MPVPPTAGGAGPSTSTATPPTTTAALLGEDPGPLVATPQRFRGLMLSLSPPHLEKAFWSSPQSHAAAMATDTAWAGFLAATSGAHAWWLLLLLPARRHTLQLAQCCCQVAASLAQLACMHSKHRGRYHRWRSVLLLLNRLLRLAFAVGIVASLRQHLLRGDPHAALSLLAPQHPTHYHNSTQPHPSGSANVSLGSTPPPPAPAPGSWAATRTVLQQAMWLSGSGTAFLHALVLLLPLRLQVAVQVAHCGMLLGYQLGPACQLLQQTMDAAASTSICYALNGLLDAASLASMGATPGWAQLNQRCEGGRAAVLLVVLLDLYLGLMLPLYITYKVEQWQKLAFVERVQLEEDPDDADADDELRPERSMILAVLYELLVLVLMAGQAWVLALVAIKHLPPELYTLQPLPAAPLSAAA